MYKRSRKILATGLTTALLVTSIVIPASAANDINSVSISAMVEDYITESVAEDPITELVGPTTTPPVIPATNISQKETNLVEEGKPEEETADPAEEKQEEEKTPEAKVKYPQFKDRVIVKIDSGVLNIRAEGDPEAEIVGTIDRAGIALVEEKGNGWTKIGSGNCEGYVKNDYIAFGDDAGEWAEANNIPKYIKVQGNGLRVRKDADMDADILDAVYENETYSVLGETDGWVKIEMYDGTVGYVSEDYVEVRFETPRAKTVEEIEEMRKAEEADALREKQRQEEEERARKEEESNNSNSSSGSGNSNSGSSAAERSEERIKRTEEIKKENESTITEEEEEYVAPTTHAELRADMVAYAKQFLGNPYVYGGTSLTEGCDCSGFTMRIYEHFGYSIPRAGGQRTFGKLITVSEAQPGDLIFYTGHVTMYIGDGKVIHASSERVGIIISSLSYSGTPLFARNIIDAY